MKLSEFKQALNNMKTISFVQPNGEIVPAHFHITEIGLTTKHFIDCGGDVHLNKLANIQIWVAADFDHRLQASSLLNIIAQSEKILGVEDLEIEVEYQTDTIGKYGLALQGNNFILQAKQTDCLAKIKCDIPLVKPKIKLSTSNNNNSCTPGGGCC